MRSIYSNATITKPTSWYYPRLTLVQHDSIAENPYRDKTHANVTPLWIRSDIAMASLVRAMSKTPMCSGSLVATLHTRCLVVAEGSQFLVFPVTSYHPGLLLVQSPATPRCYIRCEIVAYPLVIGTNHALQNCCQHVRTMVLTLLDHSIAIGTFIIGGYWRRLVSLLITINVHGDKKFLTSLLT